jgi:hypothetical protein
MHGSRGAGQRPVRVARPLDRGPRRSERRTVQIKLSPYESVTLQVKTRSHPASYVLSIGESKWSCEHDAKAIGNVCASRLLGRCVAARSRRVVPGRGCLVDCRGSDDGVIALAGARRLSARMQRVSRRVRSHGSSCWLACAVRQLDGEGASTHEHSGILQRRARALRAGIDACLAMSEPACFVKRRGSNKMLATQIETDRSMHSHGREVRAMRSSLGGSIRVRMPAAASVGATSRSNGGDKT